jgi:hypothetical protein
MYIALTLISSGQDWDYPQPLRAWLNYEYVDFLLRAEKSLKVKITRFLTGPLPAAWLALGDSYEIPACNFDVYS